MLVGFCVSLWLAVGSTLYPPSEETMGVLPSFTGSCSSANVTLNSSSNHEQTSILTPLHPADRRSERSFFYIDGTNCLIKHVKCYFKIICLSFSLSFKLVLFTPPSYPPNISGINNFYCMSYLYFGAMATSSVILVGLIVSYVTGKTIRNALCR